MTDEDTLMETLSRIAATVDAVPEHVTAAARAAFEMRALDAGLAALVHDSADEPALAGVRDAGTDRLLSFEFPAAAGSTPISVEMQVGTLPEHRRDVVGQVAGGPMRSATLDTAAGSRDIAVDDGLFVVRDVPAGPMRMTFTTAAGARVVTSWVTV